MPIIKIHFKNLIKVKKKWILYETYIGKYKNSQQCCAPLLFF